MGAPIHPCANAAKALDDAGYAYEVKTVRGFKRLPFSKAGGARDEIKELSDQEDVPILVLGDGDVITGNRAIIDWARAHPAVPSPS